MTFANNIKPTNMVAWPTVALLVTAGAFTLGQSTIKGQVYFYTFGIVIHATKFIN